MLVRLNAFARASAILIFSGLIAAPFPALAKLLPLSSQQVTRLGIRTAPVNAGGRVNPIRSKTK